MFPIVCFSSCIWLLIKRFCFLHHFCVWGFGRCVFFPRVLRIIFFGTMLGHCSLVDLSFFSNFVLLDCRKWRKTIKHKLVLIFVVKVVDFMVVPTSTDSVQSVIEICKRQTNTGRQCREPSMMALWSRVRGLPPALFTLIVGNWFLTASPVVFLLLYSTKDISTCSEPGVFVNREVFKFPFL